MISGSPREGNTESALKHLSEKLKPLGHEPELILLREADFTGCGGCLKCDKTGECSDCNSPWRICNKTTIIERQYDNDKYKPIINIVIVGEELGI